MKCRFCKSNLEQVFIDLGMSPLANSYLKFENLNDVEPYYPLRTFVCSQCFLVQLGEFKTPVEIFADYAYFSSFSKTWLSHAEDYVNTLVDRFELNQKNLVGSCFGKIMWSNSVETLNYGMLRKIRQSFLII